MDARVRLAASAVSRGCRGLRGVGPGLQLLLCIRCRVASADAGALKERTAFT